MIDAKPSTKPVVHAALFDMDGLLFDTERLSLELWDTALEQHDYRIAPEILELTIGRSEQVTKQLLIDTLGSGFPYEQVAACYAELGRDRIEADGVPRKPGTTDLLEFLAAAGILRAVATSSPRATAQYLLEQSGLIGHFQSVITADDVAHSKPDPDIFLKAAQSLGVAPQHCVVFEDSPAGIRAAHAAGALPILIPDLVTPDEGIRALCFAECRNLHKALELINDRLHLTAPASSAVGEHPPRR